MASSTIKEIKKEPHKFLVGGQWRDSRETLEIRNPYNGEIVGAIYRPSEEDIEDAVKAAVKALEATRSLPTYKRSEFLSTIQKGIIQRKEELARSITLEVGKPITDSRREVERAVEVLRLASEEARRIGGEVIPMDLVEGTKGRLAITRHFPVGPVLGITPFNFPLNLICHKLAPALAAGNTIIIKPASAAPLTALLLVEIVSASGLPEGTLSILPCSSNLAEKLVKDDRLKMLTFTGSASVGWHLKGIAGKKKVVLELGGNAGTIIDRDTDIEYAAERCTYGGYVYSGQSCISLQRIYVHEEVYKPFLSVLEAHVKGLKMGDPMEEDTKIGPLITPEAGKRLETWIKEAVSQGAKIIIGGATKRVAPTLQGNFLEPTILVDTSPEMRVNCEEAFGPLVTVSRFSSFEKALEEINRSRYGLQTSVFTRDINKVFLAYRTLEVGSVIINDVPTFRADHMPYGGVKDSGMGREGIKYAIEEMTEPRLLVLNLRESL